MEIKKCMRCMRDTDAAICPHCGFSLAKYQKPQKALGCGSILNARYLLGESKETPASLHYSAFDLGQEKTVMITAFLPDAARTPDTQNAKQNFNLTVQRAIELNNIPMISHVQDVFQENGINYGVTDNWSPKTLTKVIRDSGPMKWDQACKIFSAAAAALQAVHAAGFVHCDVNPENLFLTDTGVVVQLNLVSLSEPLKGRIGHIAPWVSFGAPEALKPSGAVGTWTDVYALAATMIYALTGTLPPSAPERMAGKALRLDMPPLSKLPDAVIAALRNALELDPNKRTARMDLFWKGLSPKNSAKTPSVGRGAGKKGSSPAKPASAGASNKPKKKGLITAIAAAAVVIALGGFLVYYSIQNNHYKTAMAAFEAAQYADAAAQFQKLGGFKDSESMVQSADQHIHYNAGLEAQARGAYADAITEFEAAPDVSGVDQQLGACHMSLGQEYLTKKAYKDAMQAFSKAKEYKAKNSDAFYTYADGLNDLEKKAYDSAITKLSKNLGITKDTASPMEAYDQRVKQLVNEGKYEAAEKVNKDYIRFCTSNKCATTTADALMDTIILCQAEELYDAGYLADAKGAFERASEGAVYEDIDRDARLKKLTKHDKLVSLEGDWHTVSGKSTLSSSGWVYYYDLSSSQKLPFSIRFVLHDDNTITATGSCTWLSCANLLTVSQKTFDFSSAVNMNYLHLTDVESIQSSVTITYYNDTLNIGFTAKDGTSVQYSYAKGK